MGLMTIDAMATNLQARLPMALDTGFCFTRINEAFSWIEQQGAFLWGQRIAILQCPTGLHSINLTGNSILGPDTIDLTTMDFGKPISVWPSPSTAMNVKIPYVSPMLIGLHQEYNNAPIPGVFSAWTLIYSVTNLCFQIYFAPSAAAVTDVPGDNFAAQFNIMYPPLATGQFFPTPPQFDQTIIDLAEAEIRRLYGLAGWDSAVKKATASAMLLADPYRVEKIEEGLNEQGKATQEAQLQRAQ